MTEDEDRYYTVTEERKCDQRVELHEAVMLAGKFSEKNAACFMKVLLEIKINLIIFSPLWKA